MYIQERVRNIYREKFLLNISTETKFVHKLTIKRYFKVVNQCKIHKIKYNHVLPHKIL